MLFLFNMEHKLYIENSNLLNTFFTLYFNICKFNLKYYFRCLGSSHTNNVQTTYNIPVVLNNKKLFYFLQCCYDFDH